MAKKVVCGKKTIRFKTKRGRTVSFTGNPCGATPGTTAKRRAQGRRLQREYSCAQNKRTGKFTSCSER